MKKLINKVFFILAITLFLSFGSVYAASLKVGSATGNQGTLVSVPVNLTLSSLTSAVIFDIKYDPLVLSLNTPNTANSVDFGSTISSTTYFRKVGDNIASGKASFFLMEFPTGSFTGTIPNGEILKLKFNILSTAVTGNTNLIISNITILDKNNASISVSGSTSGTVNVQVGADYTIKKTTNTFNINGDLSEFSLANTINIDSGRTVRALWDTNNLYLGYSITDPQKNAVITTRDGDIWSEDGVEWAIDTGNNAGSGMNADDYHGIVNYINTKYDSKGTSSGVSNKTIWNGNWQSSVLNTANGYNVEIRIPWSDFSGFTASDNKFVKMGFLVNNKTNSITSSKAWPDFASGFEDASKWGSVMLEGNSVCPDSDGDAHQYVICGGDDYNDKDSSVYLVSGCNPGDTNSNGCISPIELNNYIQRWFVSSSDVPMIKLANAIELWRLGGC